MMSQDIQTRREEQALTIRTLLAQAMQLASQMNHHSSQVTVLFKKRESARKDLQEARAVLAGLHVEAGAIRVILPEKLPRCSCEGVDVQIEHYDPEEEGLARYTVTGCPFKDSLWLIDYLATHEQLSPFTRADTVILHNVLYQFVDGKWMPVDFVT